MNDHMTANQQRALECAQGAREQGMTLCAYARQRGFNERQVYDAIAALRRKGTLPAPGSMSVSRRNDFVAVRIAPAAVDSAVPSDSVVCQIRMGSALIQCHHWPPAAWLATLAPVGVDAATAGH